MTRIKICGNTNYEDVEAALELRVDMLGFILTPSPRRVPLESAPRLIAEVPRSVETVGVFVDEPASTIAQVLESCRVDAIQVYRPLEDSDRSLGVRLIRAVRVRDGSESLESDGSERILLDTWQPGFAGGGSGRTWDWELARSLARRRQLIVSGGLRPENVGSAVERLRPWGVDVASGVERRPGLKDRRKLEAFVRAVREADSAAERRA